MTIYAVLVGVTLIGYPIAGRLSRKRQKEIYCTFMFILLTLVIGLRSRYIGGVDTNISYIPAFERICRQSMAQVIARQGAKDVFFYICTKLFTYISQDVVLYLLTIAGFVSYSYSRFILRYSNNPIISYLMFFALGFLAMSFQQLRQIVALSIVLFSYEPIKERKIIRYVLTIIIASLFHMSAVLFLVAYPLAEMKVGLKQWNIMGLSVILCIAGKSIVQQVISFFAAQTQYESYFTGSYANTLSISGVIILFAIYVAGLVLGYRVIKNDKEIRICLNMSALAVCFMAVAMVLGEFQRLSKGFGAYNLVLIPNVLEYYKSRGKHTRNSFLYTTFIIIVLVVYFLFFSLSDAKMLPYQFFWQIGN